MLARLPKPKDEILEILGFIFAKGVLIIIEEKFKETINVMLAEEEQEKGENFVYQFVFLQLNGLNLQENAVIRLKNKYIDIKEREVNIKILSRRSGNQTPLNVDIKDEVTFKKSSSRFSVSSSRVNSR